MLYRVFLSVENADLIILRELDYSDWRSSNLDGFQRIPGALKALYRITSHKAVVEESCNKMR